jgi:sugar lactone lactonase YvrE
MRKQLTPCAFVGIGLCLLGLSSMALAADNEAPAYQVNRLTLPDSVIGHVGGLTFTPDGRLAVAFQRRGQVFLYEPDTENWQRFAYGLHEPLGLHAEDNHTLVAMHRPELTRLSDTNGDGRADRYDTITDDFGMSGNYHEFAYGPAVGPEGNYYIGLNTASNGAGTFPKDELRGRFNKNGRPGRMYACVPYRGWVLRVSPQGEVEPWAPGFRSPNGLGFDQQGRLLTTDNQGDWVGTSPVHVVKRGQFYGHVSSLVWVPGFEGNPLKRPVKELDKMRTRPAVQLPHGMLSNSPTKPVAIPEDSAMATFAGQTLIGEMNHKHLLRVMLEDVAGHTQGAATKMLEGQIARGTNRLAFGPDGDLWLGHTQRDRGWVGGQGIERVQGTGGTPFAVKNMSLTRRGFELTFTRPLDRAAARKPDTYQFRRYYYKYHRPYGSDKQDVQPVDVQRVRVTSNDQRVRLALDALKPGYVYELRLDGLTSRQGHKLNAPLVVYTANYLRDGSTAYPQHELAPPIALADQPGGRIEAEAAQVQMRVNVERGHANHTGQGYLDPGKGQRVQIGWDVDVKQAGTYRLSIRYALGGGQRPMTLKVNDQGAQRLSFAGTGGWNTWKTQGAHIKLKRGVNRITLHGGAEGGPNIDRLRLKQAN